MAPRHLARLLGERKLKISDVAHDTGIDRRTLMRLYADTAERVESDVLDKPCDYFQVELDMLLERVPR
jgi:putative transcriptional regulator